MKSQEKPVNKAQVQNLRRVNPKGGYVVVYILGLIGGGPDKSPVTTSFVNRRIIHLPSGLFCLLSQLDALAIAFMAEFNDALVLFSVPADPKHVLNISCDFSESPVLPKHPAASFLHALNLKGDFGLNSEELDPIPFRFGGWLL